MDTIWERTEQAILEQAIADEAEAEPMCHHFDPEGTALLVLQDYHEAQDEEMAAMILEKDPFQATGYGYPLSWVDGLLKIEGYSDAA